MLLLDNREVKRGWEELKTSVNGLFEKHGAEVVSARRWDERRLTYQINRQKRATYLLMYFNADAPQVQAIRRDMEFNDAMLRNFVTVCEKIPDEAFEPEASFDMSAIRVDDDPPTEPASSASSEKATTKAAPAEKVTAEAAPAEKATAEAAPAEKATAEAAPAEKVTAEAAPAEKATAEAETSGEAKSKEAPAAKAAGDETSGEAPAAPAEESSK
jgi:ribosomal protein S6